MHSRHVLLALRHADRQHGVRTRRSNVLHTQGEGGGGQEGVDSARTRFASNLLGRAENEGRSKQGRVAECLRGSDHKGGRHAAVLETRVDDSACFLDRVDLNAAQALGSGRWHTNAPMRTFRAGKETKTLGGFGLLGPSSPRLGARSVQCLLSRVAHAIAAQPQPAQRSDRHTPPLLFSFFLPWNTVVTSTKTPSSGLSRRGILSMVGSGLSRSWMFSV